MIDEIPENSSVTAAGPAPAAPQAPVAEIPPPKPMLSARAATLLLGALMLTALAAAGVYLARRQLGREPAAAAEPSGADATPAPAPAIEINEPEGTPLAGEGPAPDKIFNRAIDGVKAGAAAIHAAPSSADGAINRLPPAPEAGEGNETLQNAAKDAAKRLAPGSRPSSEIDLSAGDPSAALEKLERAAAQPAQDFSPPPVAHAGAGIGDALNLDIARLAGGLEAERQHTERQAAEIARLNAELAAMKAQESPQTRLAKAALTFSALEAKARSGAPYRREFDDYRRAGGARLPPALATGADAGLSTLAALKLEFPGVRDAALAAARRAAAKGPLAQLGANLAALMRLRRAAPTEGAGAAAVLSRAEARLQADDLDGALADLKGLAGAARSEASPWIEKASARADADAALADLNRALIRSLETEKG